ncbi:DUF1929 domain-containing protein [Bradyrhizobium diazoefficiens]|uniref:galactose oxidase-like domain-containing protein n=1 Tax=Bradyrhizobium diazoefficiens TaxID=1355477 RepID=UPI00190ADCC3|nr:galactose oxidase-like domain-containing protein [Bradyrhizobium diazoefficiens]MBK3666274.1 DUF1929 domain-containing protein [Bradyrhizobium diazoefficiens]
MTCDCENSGSADDARHAREGLWEQVIQLPNVPVHTHLLPNGKVLFWGRRTDLDGGMDQHDTDVYLLDPASLQIRRTRSPIMPDGSSVNLFCSGHAFLSDGRLFIAGGHLVDGEGVNQASLYDWKTNSWTPLPPMNHGRWYPSVIALLDGDILVTSGSYREGPNTWQNNHVPQIWSAAGGWRDLSGMVLSLYPRLHATSQDRVFAAGTDPISQFLDPTGGGIWSKAPSRHEGDRQYAPSLTYAPGKIIYIGGGNDPDSKIPTAACEVIDFGETDPVWREIRPMSRPRRQHNATLLADGTVLVTGGTKGGNGDGFNDLTPGEPVHEAELFSPRDGQWTTLAPEAEDRCYHSTALLLPDGRVLSAGGGEYLPNGQPIDSKDVHTSAQIFSPPYLFRGARPQIEDAPAEAQAGSTLSLRFSGPAPVRASLVKPGSVTHSMDTNQRFVEIACDVQGQHASITLPSDQSTCPPAIYMLFLLTADGIPSKARFIRIEQARQIAKAPADPANAKGLALATEALSTHDRRIEAAAQGTKVVIGLTSRCPYGLAACWGGAYQTLKALKDVDTVKAIANASDSTAEVFLRKQDLPDLADWLATFRDMAKGSYDFRGAEVILTGAAELDQDQLILRGNGWLIGLGPLGPADKVQWDWSRRTAALPTSAELSAFDDLLARVRASGPLPQVTVTGPLVKDNGAVRLHLRQTD